jgi:hypothetical protein
VDKLLSPNGRYELDLTNSGQLLLYRRADGTVRVIAPADPSPPVEVPTPVPPPIPSPVDPRIVRANFCNLRDSTGRAIFSSCLAAQTPAMQDEWIAREQAAGGTHYVLSIQAGYAPVYPEEINFHTAGRMPEWLTALNRVLAARLVPVVVLDPGNPPFPGTSYLRSLISEIPVSYYDRCIWVCGWECVKGAWSSLQFNAANLALRDEVGPRALLACHLSPGRASFASHPLEADDPWQGHELAAWRKECGPQFDLFLYQSLPPAEGAPFDVTAPDSWGERAKEVADRFLGLPGAPDWFAGAVSRPTLIWFEGTATTFIRGQSTSAWAREVARYAKTLGFQGFGNGLP